MPILSASQITKDFSNINILQGVSFLIEEKDKVGLIGNNGSGKTTLLRILIGELEMSSGEIHYSKGLKFGYLEQSPKFFETTLYEEMLSPFKDILQMEEDMRAMEEEISKAPSNLQELLEKYAFLQEKFHSLNGYSVKSQVEGMLKGLGFTEDQYDLNPANLSGGEKSRLLLGKVLLNNPDILFLDEPTNHLDLDAVSFLEKYLKDFQGTLILISHDRYFLDAVVNKIFLLENGKVEIYRGNYSQFYKLRKKELEIRKKQYENQQRDIKRQEEIIRRFKNYGNARYIKQAQSREKLLDKMKKTDPVLEKSQAAKITFTPKLTTGFNVLSAKNLKKSYSRTLFQNISFDIYKNDRIGLIGPNGLGKSTLFKIIMKEVEPDEGEVVYGSNLDISYFDQELSDLNLEGTVMEELWDAYPKFNHFQVRSYLAKFNFVGDDIFKIVGDLSGGEKARLSLLKLMLKGGNLLLLDEPTNHLDIDSKEALESALTDFEGTILAISHDRYFLNRIANKIFAMDEEKISEYLGNYDYYLEKISENDEEDDEEYISKTEKNREKKNQREERELKREKKRQLQNLEDEIHSLEEELKKIDEELLDPDLYDDYERVDEISRKRTEVQEKLDALMEDWMDFE